MKSKCIRIFHFRIFIVNDSIDHITKQWDKIYQYAKNGEKIKAIKAYRELSLGVGCSLKEAYEFVNDLQAKINK